MLTHSFVYTLARAHKHTLTHLPTFKLVHKRNTQRTHTPFLPLVPVGCLWPWVQLITEDSCLAASLLPLQHSLTLPRLPRLPCLPPLACSRAHGSCRWVTYTHTHSNVYSHTNKRIHTYILHLFYISTSHTQTQTAAYASTCPCRTSVKACLV